MLTELNKQQKSVDTYVSKVIDLLAKNDIIGKEADDIKAKSIANLLKLQQQQILEENRAQTEMGLVLMKADKEKELYLFQHELKMKELELQLEIAKASNK